MVFNVHIRLIRDGEKGCGGGGGKGVWRCGEEGVIYLSLHCHHQNDSCIKMSSDESHFNVSVGSDGQSHRTVSADHNLFEDKGEPKRYRTEVLPLTSINNALPLGQTGSLLHMQRDSCLIRRRLGKSEPRGNLCYYFI